MTDRILSGVVLVLFVALLIVLHKAKTARAETEPRDVGLHLFAEDCGDDTQEWPVHDCDGCDQCGAPMVIEDCAMVPPLAEDPVAIRLGIVPVPSEYLEELWRRSP